MKYLRLYADAQGESHFEPMSPELEMIAYAPPAPAIGVSEPTDASRFVNVSFPANWFGDMHQTPRRQLFVVLEGVIEGTTSLNQVVEFSAGDMVLMEDTHGKGHATRTLGDQGVRALMVHLE